MAYHSNNSLYRDPRGGIVAGVCAGLSEYLKIDVTIVRIIAAILIGAYGSGLLIYLILWVVLPPKVYEY